MKIFSASFAYNTNLTKEAILSRLPAIANANRRFGFYFKYRQVDGRHWLVPEYVMPSRRLSITIEILFGEETDNVKMVLHFEIPSYIKQLIVFAVVIFVGLFVTFLIIDPDRIDTAKWIYLAMPFITVALLWFQFSSQVNYYVKAFKEAWHYTESSQS